MGRGLLQLLESDCWIAVAGRFSGDVFGGSLTRESVNPLFLERKSGHSSYVETVLQTVIKSVKPVFSGFPG